MTTRGALRRRRGGTFTIIVLVSSALLLGIGGAFVGSSKALTELVGQRERQELAKQALTGAAEWSTVHAPDVTPERGPETAKLRFSRATVDVKITAAHEAFMVEATALVAPKLTQSAHWVLSKKGDAWVVTRFELK